MTVLEFIPLYIWIFFAIPCLAGYGVQKITWQRHKLLEEFNKKKHAIIIVGNSPKDQEYKQLLNYPWYQIRIWLKAKWGFIKAWRIWQYFLIMLALIVFLIACFILYKIQKSSTIFGFQLTIVDVSPRDIGFLFAGLFAPSLTLMGFYFSNRRNQAMKKQAEAQFDQNKIHANRNLDDRFIKSMELINRKNPYQQLGGIATLHAIGTESDNPFIGPTRDILTDFIREKCFVSKTNSIDKKKILLQQTIRAFYALCAIQEKRDLPKHNYADLSYCNLYGLKAPHLIIKNIILNHTNLSKAKLSGADLSGANLSGADLSEANLMVADLIGANLLRADFKKANLYGANLIGANLSRADFKKANLYGANLRKANLYGADLREANLDKANLRKANLSGANFQGAELIWQQKITQFEHFKKTPEDSFLKAITDISNYENEFLQQLQPAKWDEQNPPKNLPMKVEQELKKLKRL